MKIFYYAGHVIGRLIRICIDTPMIAFLYSIM